MDAADLRVAYATRYLEGEPQSNEYIYSLD